MKKKQLHPSVQQFKEFVKRHPAIIREVRENQLSWQQLYEEWYLLGEEDPRWQRYKGKGTTDTTSLATAKTDGTETKTDVANKIMAMIKNVDMNQLQSYVTNLHDAIGTVQNLLSQFQPSNEAKETVNKEQNSQRERNPFLFRRD